MRWGELGQSQRWATHSIEFTKGNRVVRRGDWNSPSVDSVGYWARTGVEATRHSARMDQRRHWRHLQDHLEIYVQAGIKKPVSIYPSTRGLGKLKAGVEWYLLKGAATNHFHAGAFLRSGLDEGLPDLQFHFLPIAMNYDGSQQVNHHGIQAHVGPMKPLSRGRVSIQSVIHSRRPRFSSTISVPTKTGR